MTLHISVVEELYLMESKSQCQLLTCSKLSLSRERIDLWSYTLDIPMRQVGSELFFTPESVQTNMSAPIREYPS